MFEIVDDLCFMFEVLYEFLGVFFLVMYFDGDVLVVWVLLCFVDVCYVFGFDEVYVGVVGEWKGLFYYWWSGWCGLVYVDVNVEEVLIDEIVYCLMVWLEYCISIEECCVYCDVVIVVVDE